MHHFSLDGFVVERMLSHDAVTKSIAFLGSFPDREGQAVVRVSRQHFVPDFPQCKEILESKQTVLTETKFTNDIYSKVLLL